MKANVSRRVFLVLIAACALVPTPTFGAKPPNILFAIADDHSYPHTSAYGFRAISTPAFDRVAKRGVLFTNAFVSSPGCSPSRAALLTGRHTWQLEEAGTHASSFPAKHVVYPDLLEKAGYFVGYTGKGWGPGDWKAGGRLRNPAGPEYNQRKLEPPLKGISETDYASNFKDFLDARLKDQPFCFWFGAHEPHRRYDEGAGLKAGKKLEDVQVPAFLPDTPEVRSDILDYCVEIEWFDRHLGRMLKILEERGELENTLVVVTADNGMPFPRAKANPYEFGIHVPLAISWPARVPAGRTVNDPVSLVDLAPTFLQAAEISASATRTMLGRSLMNILRSDQSGSVDRSRQTVFSARERHSSSRPSNLGYPARAVRSRDYLYIRNLKPERWPAGDPQSYNENGQLGPMHGAYHDIDASPTLTFLASKREDSKISPYFHKAVDKRPAEELYDVRNDPGCVNNLAGSPELVSVKQQLSAALERYLTETGDPRLGENGEVFETYPRYSPIRKFPAPASTYYPGPANSWERKRPEEVGMNSRLLQEAIDYALAHESPESKELSLTITLGNAGEPHGEIIGPTKDRGSLNGVILRHGYIVAEWGDTGRVDMTFSVTKSYLSTVAGLALDYGLIRDLNDPVKE